METFTDASHGIKFTYGYLITYNGLPVSWASRKASYTTLSVCSSELGAAVEATKATMHHRDVLRDMGVEMKEPTTIWCDNQAVVRITQSDVISARLRHIRIRIAWLREQVRAGHVVFKWISTKDQLADIFTKPLAKSIFNDLASKFMA